MPYNLMYQGLRFQRMENVKLSPLSQGYERGLLGCKIKAI